MIHFFAFSFISTGKFYITETNKTIIINCKSSWCFETAHHVGNGSKTDARKYETGLNYIFVFYWMKTYIFPPFYFLYMFEWFYCRKAWIIYWVFLHPSPPLAFYFLYVDELSRASGKLKFMIVKTSKNFHFMSPAGKNT